MNPSGTRQFHVFFVAAFLHSHEMAEGSREQAFHHITCWTAIPSADGE
jgi:hypothetical protein